MKKLLFNVLSLAFVVWAGLLTQAGRADVVKAGDSLAFNIDLSQVSQAVGPYSSIYGSAPSVMLTGDTYNLAPLAQSATTAYYISAAPSNVLHTFNSSPGKLHGANLLYAPGTNFVVSEALTSIGPNQYLVQVQLTSVGTNGPNAWVPTGATSPTGNFVSWRMDLGAFAAAADRLTPGLGLVSIDSATMSVFNSAGASLFSGPMSNNASNLTGMAGLGVIGIGGGNIAGFNLAAFQLAWTYTTVPEPTSALTVGLFGFCALLRRRRA